VLSSAIFDGLIAEYRESGRLLGVMTGVQRERVIYLQHVMVWPHAPAGTLLRMLDRIERLAWDRQPESVVLDVEHDHPFAAALKVLARRRGYQPFRETDTTTWFVKRERP